MHGDFAWYHRRLNHTNAKLTCSCGCDKTPEHLALCHKTLGSFIQWPIRPSTPPSSRSKGLAYLAELLTNLDAFRAFLQITQYYTKGLLVAATLASSNNKLSYYTDSVLSAAAGLTEQ
jgi:hypothetical protein